MTGTHLIQQASGELVYSTDADEIIEAWAKGRSVERVPAPVSRCGCARCAVVAEESSADIARMMRENRSNL